MSERKLGLHLYHGRQRPDEHLEDWGEDGPVLEIAWYHETYRSVAAVGLPDARKDQLFLDTWEKGKKDGVYVEDLFHYDGRFYGDVEIGFCDESYEPFDPEKAVFPKDKDWKDIPKDPNRVYDSDEE